MTDQEKRFTSSFPMAQPNQTDGVSSFTNELNWPILTLSLLAVFGTVGNLLVCASICLDKHLQTVTNFFLFSLAIADCLVSLIVLPLSIIKDFQGSWQLPVLLCNIYVFLDVLLCTTSIWHLTVVSIDRFLHISRPFRSRKRSKLKTFLMILSIWMFSIGISGTVLRLGFTDRANILTTTTDHRQHCTLNNRSFIIFGSIICFHIPCVLMLVSYSLSVHRLQKEASKCYSDTDENAVRISQTSTHLLRRHQSKRKRSLRGTSSTVSLPTPLPSRSPTIVEVSHSQTHLEWP